MNSNNNNNNNNVFEDDYDDVFFAFSPDDDDKASTLSNPNQLIPSSSSSYISSSNHQTHSHPHHLHQTVGAPYLTNGDNGNDLHDKQQAGFDAYNDLMVMTETTAPETADPDSYDSVLFGDDNDNFVDDYAYDDLFTMVEADQQDGGATVPRRNQQKRSSAMLLSMMGDINDLDALHNDFLRQNDQEGIILPPSSNNNNNNNNNNRNQIGRIMSEGVLSFGEQDDPFASQYDHFVDDENYGNNQDTNQQQNQRGGNEASPITSSSSSSISVGQNDDAGGGMGKRNSSDSSSGSPSRGGGDGGSNKSKSHKVDVGDLHPSLLAPFSAHGGDDEDADDEDDFQMLQLEPDDIATTTQSLLHASTLIQQQQQQHSNNILNSKLSSSDFITNHDNSLKNYNNQQDAAEHYHHFYQNQRSNDEIDLVDADASRRRRERRRGATARHVTWAVDPSKIPEQALQSDAASTTLTTRTTSGSSNTSDASNKVTQKQNQNNKNRQANTVDAAADDNYDDSDSDDDNDENINRNMTEVFLFDVKETINLVKSTYWAKPGIPWDDYFQILREMNGGYLTQIQQKMYDDRVFMENELERQHRHRQQLDRLRQAQREALLQQQQQQNFSRYYPNLASNNANADVMNHHSEQIKITNIINRNYTAAGGVANNWLSQLQQIRVGGVGGGGNSGLTNNSIQNATSSSSTSSASANNTATTGNNGGVDASASAVLINGNFIIAPFCASNLGLRGHSSLVTNPQQNQGANQNLFVAKMVNAFLNNNTSLSPTQQATVAALLYKGKLHEKKFCFLRDCLGRNDGIVKRTWYQLLGKSEPTVAASSSSSASFGLVKKEEVTGENGHSNDDSFFTVKKEESTGDDGDSKLLSTSTSSSSYVMPPTPSWWAKNLSDESWIVGRSATSTVAKERALNETLPRKFVISFENNNSSGGGNNNNKQEAADHERKVLDGNGEVYAFPRDYQIEKFSTSKRRIPVVGGK